MKYSIIDEVGNVRQVDENSSLLAYDDSLNYLYKILVSNGVNNIEELNQIKILIKLVLQNLHQRQIVLPLDKIISIIQNATLLNYTHHI